MEQKINKENKEQWLSLNISKDESLIFESCLNLLIEPSKSYMCFWKPYLEHAVGYLDNGSKNFILFRMGYRTKRLNEPYLNFKIKMNLNNIKLVYNYFNVEFKPRNYDLNLQLPYKWFNILYSDYLLNKKEEDTIKEFIERKLK